MKEQKISQYGITGIGATLSEARLDLVRKSSAAFNGPWEPVMIRFEGHMIFIARTPTFGWGYKILWSEDTLVRYDLLCNYVNGDRDRTIVEAVKHLADAIYKPLSSWHNLKPLLEAIRDTAQREAAIADLSGRWERADLMFARRAFAESVLNLQGERAQAWAGMNPAYYNAWCGTENLGTEIPFPDAAELIQAFAGIAELNEAAQLTIEQRAYLACSKVYDGRWPQ